jgi:2-phospho-L-lactate/phosphoenolpyruvate guanylyltransferase
MTTSLPGTATATEWVAIAALKPPQQAKSRMAMPESVRAGLAVAMAMDTLATLGSSPRIRQTFLVCPDRLLREQVDGHADLNRVTVLAGEPAGDLNSAVRYGMRVARQRVPEAGLAVVPADLAAMSPFEVDLALLLAPRDRPGVVADLEEVGTVMLTVPVGTSLRPRFGRRSYAAHCRAGAQPLCDERLLGIRRDMDTLDDLMGARDLLGEHTRSFLHSHGWPPVAASSQPSLLQESGATYVR